MAVTLRASLRQTRGNALNTDAGANAKLKIYAGSVPADADAALGGATLLGTPIGGAGGFAASVSGTGLITANAFTSPNAVADGTASFYRLTKADDTVVAQGTVTATGGGGDLTLNTVSIVTGGPIVIASFTLQER